MGLGWIDYGRKGGTDRIEKGGGRFEISRNNTFEHGLGLFLYFGEVLLQQIREPRS